MIRRAAAVFDLARGMLIVVGIFFAGGWLHRHGIPIPGGVLGLLLFYLALVTGIIRLTWVEHAANLLLRHMVLLFVPLTVGLMEFGHILSRQAGAILASLFASFLAVLWTTGLLGKWFLREPRSDTGAEAAQ